MLGTLIKKLTWLGNIAAKFVHLHTTHPRCSWNLPCPAGIGLS